jgi:hypothetical protein
VREPVQCALDAALVVLTGAPLQRQLFARKLSALGHDVEVVTNFSNYPGGTVYDGYKVKLFQRISPKCRTVKAAWIYCE